MCHAYIPLLPLVPALRWALRAAIKETGGDGCKPDAEREWWAKTALHCGVAMATNKKPARLSQTQLARALKAVKSVGFNLSGIEIASNGKVSLSLSEDNRDTFAELRGGPMRPSERRGASRYETLGAVLCAFEDSADFLHLAPRSRADYTRQIAKIQTDFADFPLARLTDRRTRGEFLAWRDRLAIRSVRQADYAYTVLARTLSWACERGLVPLNPCEKGGRLYRGNRADKVWTEKDEAAFMAAASPPLRLALQLALWTGQRQGDLLRLTWSAYDGARIRLSQSKTGVRVVLPVGGPLKATLDAAKRESSVILVNLDGKPWTPDGFRASWAKACKRAGVEGLTFHDLRGTAVTRLALAGATEAEIATLTGHSLRDVRTILDANYLQRDPALAESAIRKLEMRARTLA
jgi:integrase